jgi:hypothetical protein
MLYFFRNTLYIYVYFVLLNLLVLNNLKTSDRRKCVLFHLQTIFYTEFVGVFIIYIPTDSHIPICMKQEL